MANFSYLVKREDKNLISEFNDDNVLLASRYSMPYLWMLMFSSHDLVFSKVTLDDGTIQSWPTLITDVESAIKSITSKKKLLKLISAKKIDSYEGFLDLIRNCNEKYLQFNFDEIKSMSSKPEKFDTELEKLLSNMETEKLDDMDLEFIRVNCNLEYNRQIKRLFFRNDGKFINIIMGNGWLNRAPWDN